MSSDHEWDENPPKDHLPAVRSIESSAEALKARPENANPSSAKPDSDEITSAAENENQEPDQTVFNLLRAIESTGLAAHFEGANDSNAWNEQSSPSPEPRNEPSTAAPAPSKPLPVQIRRLASPPGVAGIPKLHELSLTAPSIPAVKPVVSEIAVESSPSTAPQHAEPANSKNSSLPEAEQAATEPTSQHWSRLATLLNRAKKGFSAWFRKKLSRDRRRGSRFTAPPLAAYYWTGGAPAPRKIANISSGGLYLVTNDRWYPGTRVSMTLQRTDQPTLNQKEWISIDVNIVRLGDDGVGGAFQFQGQGVYGFAASENCADKKTMERFLKRLMLDATV